MRRFILAGAFLVAAAPLASATIVLAEAPEILSVRALPTGGDNWAFDVELRHPDEGWDHYADGWEVLDPDSEVLGTRTLFHPHVEEQPFTRSLSGVVIPAEIDQVTIRAHCSVDGYEGAQTFTVELER